MNCRGCGGVLSDADRFCSLCGHVVPSPFVWTWRGPLRVAAITLTTSFGLALIFGLTSRPSSQRLHWTFTTTSEWTVWVWESIFGADVAGRVQTQGSLGAAGHVLQGSAAADVAIGAMPLTLTLLTLASAAISYRRAISALPNARSALALGGAAALLVAIPMALIALVVSVDTHEIKNLVAPSSDTGLTASAWQAVRDASGFSLSVSATDAFLTSCGLLLAVFGGLVVTKGITTRSPAATSILRLLATPLRGCSYLAIALVVGGSSL